MKKEYIVTEETIWGSSSERELRETEGYVFNLRIGRLVLFIGYRVEPEKAVISNV